MKTIAIVGITGLRNRGVEALLAPLVKHFGAAARDTALQVATWSPEYDALRFADPRITFVRDDYLLGGEWVNPSAPSASLLRRTLGKLEKEIRRSSPLSAPNPPRPMPFGRPDVLVVSGGDIFSSDYGSESLQHWVEPLRWAHAARIPIALIGHSVGRFKSDEHVRLWKEAESMASVITLREPLSYRYLVEELRTDPSRLTLAADTAFLLEPQATAATQQAAGPAAPTVALSISAGISAFAGTDAAQHAAAWLRLVHVILDTWGAHVVVVPHVQETYGDDRIVATRLWRRLGFDPRVRIFGEDLSAGEYKGVVSQCDMVIAERMHVAIAGLSSGVPTVPIGYSIKAQGILTSVLEGTDIEPGDLGIRADEFLQLDTSLRKLTDLWHRRDQLRHEIGRTLARSRTLARKNLAVIETLLDDHAERPAATPVRA